ncbi:MAG: hypothetical protein GY775_16670 [Candidatus Scalindua sp.]|nr:hypothetical protein [Candidatus Scalindua sp.]
MIETSFNDSKTLNLIINSPIQRNKIEDNLFSIDINTEKNIKLGDKMPVNIKGSDFNYDTFYYVNKFEELDSKNFKIREFESNLSSTYLLPLLDLKRDTVILKQNFINCYLRHYNYKHETGEYLYLIYRWLPAKYYAEFVSLMSKLQGFNSYVKDKDKRFDVFVFKVNTNKVRDIKLILEGKYSKISETSKKLILLFHLHINSSDYLWKVLNKCNSLREQIGKDLNCKIPEDVDLEEKMKIIEETWSYSKNN